MKLSRRTAKSRRCSAENRLIKDIQPRYNARLLDDKTFPYLMVTTDEEFPGVYVTREPKKKGVKLYGPFTSVGGLKDAVTLLQTGDEVPHVSSGYSGGR